MTDLAREYGYVGGQNNDTIVTYQQFRGGFVGSKVDHDSQSGSHVQWPGCRDCAPPKTRPGLGVRATFF